MESLMSLIVFSDRMIMSIAFASTLPGTCGQTQRAKSVKSAAESHTSLRDGAAGSGMRVHCVGSPALHFAWPGSRGAERMGRVSTCDRVSAEMRQCESLRPLAKAPFMEPAAMLRLQ